MSYTIKKLDNNLYSIRVWASSPDVFGKIKSKQKSNIKTISLAKKYVVEMQASLDESINNSEDILFKDLTNLYLKNRENRISPTTMNELTSYMIPRILKFMGNIKAKDVSTTIVQNFVDELANSKSKNNSSLNLSVGTQKKYSKQIISIINWGVGKEYLLYNRIKKIDYKYNGKDFEAKILTAEEVGEILKYLKTNYYNLYIPTLLAITIGPRRGEILGLKWENVDLENGVILLKENCVQVNKRIIVKEKMKTASSKRYIALSDFIISELIEHKKLCLALDGIEGGEFVCSNIFFGKISPSYLTHAFHDAIKNKFNIEMRFHDLRHSFNQLGYENDIDLTTRSKILGHSNVKTTNNIYTHFSLEKEKGVINTISNEIEKVFEKV